ncbi:hypothetical protein GLYMA_19G180150v4 [Glycine max]|nr:hypothetical protein GLYMA_19G180150v4 [Glycine max]KAH1078413.1 hypothetical protein GYH30_053426 [Glycine max]
MMLLILRLFVCSRVLDFPWEILWFIRFFFIRV